MNRGAASATGKRVGLVNHSAYFVSIEIGNDCRTSGSMWRTALADNSASSWSPGVGSCFLNSTSEGVAKQICSISVESS